MTNQIKANEPLPTDVIMAAVGGDDDAMKTVVKHYEGYINALATKRLYDEDGRQLAKIDRLFSEENQTEASIKEKLTEAKKEVQARKDAKEPTARTPKTKENPER